jgi:Ser/Thr protein kinase RdoA (MazF antagonist)
MQDVDLPAVVIEAAGLTTAAMTRLPWRRPLWRVEVGGVPAVLHHYPAHRAPDDLAWEHGFLQRLAQTGFPASQPVPAFAGRSWAVLAGALWGLATYLPGRSLNWEPQPDLAAVGSFMARYHDAVADLTPPAPRPGIFPLADLPSLAPWDRLPAAVGGTLAARQLRSYLDRLPGELAACGHYAFPRLVIHADFTTPNVLIDGDPPAIAGLIDFALAHEEAALADIGSGLWQSGRSEPTAIGLDLARVARFVGGYAGVRPLSPAVAPALALYLKARGLQLIVKWVCQGVADCAITLERVNWLAAHQTELTDVIAAVLRP